MTYEGKHSKERQSELWLTVWGVEQAQLQSGASKDTGLRWLTAQVSKQPRDGLCVFLYERSRMVYLQVWINTVKITEMLNASVLWMKMCVCLMALFPNICVGSRKREQLCDRMGVSLLFLLSLFPTPYSITKQYWLYCLCYFTSGSAWDLFLSTREYVSVCAWCMRSHTRYAHVHSALTSY